MSIYKRGNVYWTHFGLKGQDLRQSLRTSHWQEAKREGKKLIAKAEAGKIIGRVAGVAPDYFSRLPFAVAVEQYRTDRKPYLSASTARSEFDHSKPVAEFFTDRAARGAETRVHKIGDAMIR